MTYRFDPVPPMTPADVPSPNTVAPLQPRYVGPVGNRVSAVAGVPGDPLVYYAGAAAGGIFKTTDGGTHWEPVFDGQAAALDGKKVPEKVASIGALAVSESNPNIVWAGTGESWIRGPISIGNGIYKSVDGGQNWTHMGLSKTGRFSAVVIHPANPDIVWAGALGSCYQPSKWRGVFKTVDGGLTWKKVLPSGEGKKAPDWVEETGCSDLVADPNNPAVLYAGLWQFKLRSWTRVSGGPGSGIYKSLDGGESWRELTHGLPTQAHEVGKVSVGVSKSDSNYVYANIETGDGVPTPDFPDPANGQLWRSTDGGQRWTVMSYNRSINSRAAYYTRNAVSPDNKNEVYFFAPELVTTVDGGETLQMAGFPQAPGVDHHVGWIDPLNGARIAVGCDTGISISLNRGQTWYKIQLPISQMYQVSVDREIPYNLFGNCQDMLATWGPSYARIGYDLGQGDTGTGTIPRGLWMSAGPTGECGYTIPDPKDPDLIWSSGSSDGPNGGTIALINRRSGHWREITVKPRFTTGTPPKDVEFRFHWHLPLALSPHDNPDFPDRPPRAYAGSQYVHASDDRGQRWRIISPELTGHDERYLQSSGGLTADNLNVRMAYTTSVIAESPAEAGLVWVGTSDQRLWLGRKLGGQWDDNHELDWQEGWSWERIDLSGIEGSGLPKSGGGAWALVSCIVPSRHDPGAAYVSFDRHQAADPQPYIFKTADYGKSWSKITDGIPHSVVSYVHWLAEDVESPGLLFAGTENALYLSFDDGGRWQVMPGMPPAPISGIVVQGHFHDLVVSTFGRGWWIYDDVSPLRQLAEAGRHEVYLFQMPRPIYRFQEVAQPYAVPNDNDPTIGIDPPSPAPINFHLKRPADEAKLTFLAEGPGGTSRTVRTLELGQTIAGINRVWWDLQSDSTQIIKLRTNPPNQKDTQYCPSGVRPYSSPVAGTSFSWLVPPGRYTVRLEAVLEGQKIEAEPRNIEVRIDPSARPGLPEGEVLAAVAQQTELSLKIWDDLNRVSGDINVIEFLRFQIEQLLGWTDEQEARSILGRLERDLLDIEDRLMQRNITGFGEDLARFPARLVENLAYLGSLVVPGDFRPTDAQLETYQDLQAEVTRQRRRLTAVVAVVNDEVNPQLRSLGVPTLLTDPPDSPTCSLFDTGPAF